MKIWIVVIVSRLERLVVRLEVLVVMGVLVGFLGEGVMVWVGGGMMMVVVLL